MTAKTSDILEKMGACEESLEWLRAFDRPTFAEAWAACPDVHWRFWLGEELERCGALSPRIVRAAEAAASVAYDETRCSDLAWRNHDQAYADAIGASVEQALHDYAKRRGWL